MADTKMLSSGKLAKELGISGPKLKKALEAAGIEPDMRKGVCSYYSIDRLDEIKKKIET
ncbi:MAG: hypothetical protein ACE5HW_01440 [Candidatus Methanofastidiosia archaeon]